MRKKKPRVVLPAVEITGYAAEGKALAKTDGKVIFVSGAVPGDVADLLLTKNKKEWAEARVEKIISLSPDRVEPFCKHFGVCGGCKWQMLPYSKQLEYKQQEAEQNIRRIGHQKDFEVLPIAGADATIRYRNKLEFTAANRRYLTSDEIGRYGDDEIPQLNALGFHVPRIFDKVIDIDECWLMDDVNNLIRNGVRQYLLENQLSFYDIKAHTGWFRNLIIRYASTGELMVNAVVNDNDKPQRLEGLMQYIASSFPQITALLYTINPKWNDSIYDLNPVVWKGNDHIKEKLGPYSFIISPKSFFQTNTGQAEKLYSIALDFAGLTGNEVVYDLYCGTGSIGIFMSAHAKKIIGVELIEDAIIDAKKNAALNGVEHALFFAGDVIKICNDAFFDSHGKPDVVITDPPRAGMHADLVQKLLEIKAPRIVYVSCNTATQARDLQLLSEQYKLIKMQAVDMFPHTHHIESVALLELRN